MTRIKTTVAALLGAVLLAGVSGPASALTLELGLGNTSIADKPAPFGSVEVTYLSPTTATIRFISNLGPIGGFRYGFGDGSMVAYNLADAGNVSSALSTATAAPWASLAAGYPVSGGSGVVDGWGTFNTRWNNFDGFSYCVADITFNLTRTSGAWSSDADILALNDKDQYVAAHIFVANEDGTNTGVTGYATDGMRAIPEPATMLVLGLFGIGAGLARFRRTPIA